MLMFLILISTIGTKANEETRNVELLEEKFISNGISTEEPSNHESQIEPTDDIDFEEYMKGKFAQQDSEEQRKQQKTVTTDEYDIPEFIKQKLAEQEAKDEKQNGKQDDEQDDDIPEYFKEKLAEERAEENQRLQEESRPKNEQDNQDNIEKINEEDAAQNNTNDYQDQNKKIFNVTYEIPGSVKKRLEAEAAEYKKHHEEQTEKYPYPENDSYDIPEYIKERLEEEIAEYKNMPTIGQIRAPQ